MAFLYVIEQGAVIRKTGQRILVEKDEETLLEIPRDKLDAILVFGNVTLTTPALSDLLDSGIEVALLTRHGRIKGQLTPAKSRNIVLRLEQFRRHEDQTFRLEISREIVSAKVHNARALMRSFSYNHPEARCEVADERLSAILEQVARADALSSLNGLEGAAAQAYFEAFGRFCLGELRFEGRNRRPPRDPVNSLLSFGYTLVFNEILSLLDAMGFDPYLGFYHEVDYGRASLAADLLEEFRHPIVDRLTLHLVNHKVFRPEHFIKDARTGEVRFQQRALGTYFEQFERMMSKEKPESAAAPPGPASLRACVRAQAEAMAGLLMGRAERYIAFRLK